MSDEIKYILGDIIDYIVEQQYYHDKCCFIENTFETILYIVTSNDKPKTTEKLKTYEIHRYNMITILMREFIQKFMNNMLDSSIRERLNRYLKFSYERSKYFKILKNLNNTLVQNNIIIEKYLTSKIITIKKILYDYIQKQYTFLNIMLNKQILETLNKESVDDLFNKIIFELTICIMYFR
jgi:hypothetical protein